jgi:hypothetical protein
MAVFQGSVERLKRHTLLRELGEWLTLLSRLAGKYYHFFLAVTRWIISSLGWALNSESIYVSIRALCGTKCKPQNSYDFAGSQLL